MGDQSHAGRARPTGLGAPGTLRGRSATSPAAAWRRCGARATRRSAATSRSSCSPSGSRTTRPAHRAVHARGARGGAAVGPPQRGDDLRRRRDRPGRRRGPRAFIVMEYLAGGTVADALRVDSVRRVHAVKWLQEAASALDYAHSRGVLHRDIKPANLLLDRDRTLHVADFGIARLGTEDTITGTGQVLGTASYLAPERALGRAATEASDRYSLAVVAFELLVGRAAVHLPALRRAGPPARRGGAAGRQPSATARCRRPSTPCSPAAWPSGPRSGGRPRRTSPRRSRPRSPRPTTRPIRAAAAATRPTRPIRRGCRRAPRGRRRARARRPRGARRPPTASHRRRRWRGARVSAAAARRPERSRRSPLAGTIGSGGDRRHDRQRSTVGAATRRA